jgi:hypothetical protein
VNAQWRRRPVAWRRVGFEVVLLPPGSDEPIAIGGAAASAWHMLEEPTTAVAVAQKTGATVDEVQMGLLSLAILGLAEVQ